MKFTYNKTWNSTADNLIETYQSMHQIGNNSMIQNAIKKEILSYFPKNKDEVLAIIVQDPKINSNAIEDLKKIMITMPRFTDVQEDKEQSAREFVDDVFNNIDTLFKTRGTKSGIEIIKHIGLRITDVVKAFDVDNAYAWEMYNKGFVKTYVDTMMRKHVTRFVDAEFKNAGIQVTLTEIYKVPNRNLWDFDVCVKIPYDQLTTENLELVATKYKKLDNMIENLLY